MFAAFSHQLEGADPSSNEAYPRVIVPAPRPSEGPGSAIVRGRLDTAFRDIFLASLCLAGSQGPLGPFLEGRGRILPPQVSFSHARLFFPHPRFFFLVSFFFGLQGQTPALDSLTRNNVQSSPPCRQSGFLYGVRGKCCPFFLRRVFLEIPPKSPATGGVGKKI